MPVSGVVIRIDPQLRQQVTAAIEQLEGVELQPVPAGDTLVAVLDTASFEQEDSLSRAITDIEGVRELALSYHNFEDMVQNDL